MREGTPHSGLTTADKGMRVAGYLIDVLPTICVGLLGLIPIASAVPVGRHRGREALRKPVVRSRVRRQCT